MRLCALRVMCDVLLCGWCFVCVVFACVCSLLLKVCVVCDWLCDVVWFVLCELLNVRMCSMCLCVLIVA